MKPSAEIEVFTGKKRRATIALVGRRRQFFVQQRCIVSIITDNHTIMGKYLGHFFPQYKFYSEKSNLENLDILKYFHEIAQGIWSLDLLAMFRSDEFKHLFPFPEKPEYFTQHWNEGAAVKKIGSSDITKFFIYVKNDEFFRELSIIYRNLTKKENAELIVADKHIIPEGFLNSLGYNNDFRSVWEDWDFFTLVQHKPHNIYKAFEWYASKIYTLLGFGLCELYEKNPDTLKKCSVDKLLLAGYKVLDEAVKENIPERADFGIYRRTAFWELVEEVLESVPEGGPIYVPTEKDVFINQLKSRMASFLKNRDYDKEGGVEDRKDTIGDEDRRNINNHMDKIGQYIDDVQDYLKYQKLRECGTFRQKALFIHTKIQDKSIRAHYDDREIKTIEGFFNDLLPIKSIDEKAKNPKTGEEVSRSETIEDKTNPQPGDDITRYTDEEWKIFFTDIFRQEFDEAEMAKFLEYIPDHFDKFPLAYEEGSCLYLEMAIYSEDQLFSKYCTILNIPEDDCIKEHFRKLIRNVILNINIYREKIYLALDKQILRQANGLSAIFKNIFNEKFEKLELELFVKFIFDDLIKSPLYVDSTGRLDMDKNQRDKIYSKYCSLKGLKKNKEQRENFANLINNAIDEMNKSENDLRSRF